MLLLWLNDQVVEYPECMELFANAISLDLFILDDVQPISSTTFNTSNEISNPPEEITTSRSHGLHFVRKLGEKNPERAYGHGLTRDSRIKKSPLKLYQTLIFGGCFLLGHWNIILMSILKVMIKRLYTRILYSRHTMTRSYCFISSYPILFDSPMSLLDHHHLLTIMNTHQAITLKLMMALQQA